MSSTKLVTRLRAGAISLNLTLCHGIIGLRDATAWVARRLGPFPAVDELHRDVVAYLDADVIADGVYDAASRYSDSTSLMAGRAGVVVHLSNRLRADGFVSPLTLDLEAADMSKKVKPYLQVTQTECGLCVARSILAYYGREVTLSTIRQTLEPGRDGLSLKEIGQVLRMFGLTTNMYRVKDVRGLDSLEAPFIAYWKGYHFVVVERLGADSAVIADPMVGRVTITREELEEDFTDYVLVATPGEDFQPESLPRLWEWRGKPIWPARTKPYYAGLVLISLALFGLSLSIPALIQHLIDADDPADIGIGKILLSVAVAATAFWVFQLIRGNLTATIVERASWSLMNQTFTHLMKLPVRYFTTRPPGELVYRMSSLNGVRDLIAYRISQGALDLVTALILLGYVFYTSWKLALVVTALCLVVVVLLSVSRRLTKNVMDEEVNYAGRSQAMQLDGIVSVSSIRMGTYVDEFLDEWRGFYRRAVKAMGRRMRIQQARIGSAVSALQMFGPVLVMALGLHWVQQGHITLGETVAAQTVAALILSMWTSVYQCITEAIVASKYLERVDDIFSVSRSPRAATAPSSPARRSPCTTSTSATRRTRR